MAHQPEKLTFSVTEAAAASGLSIRKIWFELAAGRLEAVRSTGRTLVPRGSLWKYLGLDETGNPLPKRPEDKVAPQSLISEPDIPANLEREDSSTNSSSNNPTKNASDSNPPVRAWDDFFKDRYIAPEMADWTKVYRIGHAMLVPTFVDDSKALLFELDTGAFTNTLSLRAGLKADSIVPEEDALRVRGLSGEAKAVYSGKATLSFGHLQQTDPAIVILNLSNVSGHIGTEVSGFLGYGMLRLLDVKLDYRDGLVNFEYHPKH